MTASGDGALTGLQPDEALTRYGWNDRLATAFRPYREHAVPGRVVSAYRGGWRVITEGGEREAILQRGARRSAHEGGAYPAVGDWLALEPSGAGSWPIRAVLPRTGVFRRAGPADGRAGGEAEVLAANVDTIFVVTSLNRDLNIRRLERYLMLAAASLADAVIVLNKADVAADAPAAVLAVRAVAGTAPVHAVSALTGSGLEELHPYASAGRTVAFLGSSGVGKSTLVNALVGSERQATGAIREDDARGRHTTTSRELVALPGGGVLIDTPGLRSVGVFDEAESLGDTFTDIAELAAQCRFRDCRHESEPGCAVRAAIRAGDLDEARLASRAKLEREIRAAARRGTPAARADSRQFARTIRSASKTSRRTLYERDL